MSLSIHQELEFPFAMFGTMTRLLVLFSCQILGGVRVNIICDRDFSANPSISVQKIILTRPVKHLFHFPVQNLVSDKKSKDDMMFQIKHVENLFLIPEGN